MTETTEKQEEVQAIISSLEDESAAFKRMTGIAHWLIKHSHELEDQVNSLTKERDEARKLFNETYEEFCELSPQYKVLLNKHEKLKALLSKAEEENKELKEKLNTPNLFYLDDPECPDATLKGIMDIADIDEPYEVTRCVFHEIDTVSAVKKEDGSVKTFTTHAEALASLKKDEGEEV